MLSDFRSSPILSLTLSSLSDPHNLTKAGLVALITLVYFDAFSLPSFQDNKNILVYFSSSHVTCNTLLVSIVFTSLLPDLFMLEWPMDESLVSFAFLYFHSIPFILSLKTFKFYLLYHNSVQCSQSCPTLCNPMDCSMLGFPVHHQLTELAQTQVHQLGDAIQPSHPLLSPSPPALNLSQHQGLFQ